MISAKNLASGDGLGLFKPSGQFEALVSHPPLYPVSIAALLELGMDEIQAVRWISIIAFGVFVAAIPWLYSRLSGSLAYSTVLALLLVSAPAIVLSFLGSMAETLFLPLGFMGLLALRLHFKKDSKGWLLAAAILLALSSLSRYPAIAFVLAAATYVLLVPHTAIRNRVGKAGLLAGTTLAGLMVFLLWSRTAFGAGTPRAMQPGLRPVVGVADFAKAIGVVLWEWKPIPPPEVIRFLLTPAWIQPLRVTLLLGFTIFTLLAIGSFLYSRDSLPSKWPRSGLARTAALMALTLGWYLALLATAFFFSFPTPDIDGRTLLPILIAAIIFIVAAAKDLEPSARRRRMFRVSTLGLAGLVLAGNGLMSWDILSGLHRTGAGFTSAAWRDSETMRAVEMIPADAILISNAPESVLLHLSRYPHDITLLEGILRAAAGGETCLKTGPVVAILFDLEGAEGETSEHLELVVEETAERGLSNPEVDSYRDGAVVTVNDPCQ
jgi:4-amino-4-deoxy-L-arabinose transferase-like glycosyltransferase